jgi:DNA-binding MarR family transcriptional regulator
MSTLALSAYSDFLSEEVDSELQLQTLRVFLFVAHRGSCTQKDLEIGLRITNGSASRNVSYWTDLRFDKRPGKGFIIRIEDPVDRRFKVLTLTKSGRDFLERLKQVAKGGLQAGQDERAS